MKVLLLDNDSSGVSLGMDLALRAQEAGHEVAYWMPAKCKLAGVGLVKRADHDWESLMDWAELIVPTGNSKLQEPLAPYFGKGYPIFASGAKGIELELDREVGQRVLKECGVETLPYHTVQNIDEALAIIKRTKLAYAIKPWGGTNDKSLTCVAKDADEAVFMLTRWKAAGLNGQLMLQEKCDGVEMGIAGWFGPGGWSAAIEESFEHKKFLVGDLGQNTGEMGTVIRHVKKSRLFTEVLEPVTDYLHSVNYVGDCSVNCIINDDGAWPLEFTCRLGWPDFCIRQAVIQSDPVEWMADLLYGRDTLEVSTDIAIGVLLCHGDFPSMHSKDEDWAGFPINGINEDNYEHLHFHQVALGKVPKTEGSIVMEVTAGTYMMIVSQTGKTVSAAQSAVYKTIKELAIPSNLMYRTDIGDRLEKDLKELQSNGYAKGMIY